MITWSMISSDNAASRFLAPAFGAGTDDQGFDLSFDLHDKQSDEGVPLAIADGTWRWRASDRSRHLVADLSRRLSEPIFPSAADIENTFWDAVSMQDEETKPKHKDSPPLWLSRLKQNLDDARACVSGSAPGGRLPDSLGANVPPVFRTICFGLSPTRIGRGCSETFC